VHSVAGRILGPADYGRYGLVVTLTTMVIVLIGNGIPTAMSKYVSASLEKDPANIHSINEKPLSSRWASSALSPSSSSSWRPLSPGRYADPSLTPLFASPRSSFPLSPQPLSIITT